MEGIFSRLASVSRGTVERVHGQDVVIVPVSRSDVNRGPVPISGQEYPTTACFYQNTLLENEAMAQPQAGAGRRTMNRNARIQASITLVADKELRTDFYMKRVDDGAWFTVVQIDPDGLGGVMALVAAAAAPEGF